MRLDHLLSKREEVGVALLSSCQGVHAAVAAGVQKPGLPGRMRERGQGHMANERARGGAKRAEGEAFVAWAE